MISDLYNLVKKPIESFASDFQSAYDVASTTFGGFLDDIESEASSAWDYLTGSAREDFFESGQLMYDDPTQVASPAPAPVPAVVIWHHCLVPLNLS